MLWSLIILQYRNIEPETDPHKEFVGAVHCIACCIDVSCKMKQLITVGLSLQQCDTAENGDVLEDKDLWVSCNKQLLKM